MPTDRPTPRWGEAIAQGLHDLPTACPHPNLDDIEDPNDPALCPNCIDRVREAVGLPTLCEQENEADFHA